VFKKESGKENGVKEGVRSGGGCLGRIRIRRKRVWGSRIRRRVGRKESGQENGV